MSEAAENNSLRLHSGPPVFNNVSVLFVGEYGINKKKLAKGLISEATNFTLSIRMTSKLPMQPCDPPYSRIDFICFIIDILRKESLINLQNAVKHIDAEYFMGRSCLIVHQPDKCRKQSAIDLDCIKEVAKMYNLITIYGDIETQPYRVANQILRIVEISAGFKKNLQSLFLLGLL
ncbi:centromere protein M-like [Argonauta hians]